MSGIFKFKEFTVQQDRCAMKVGTDGVLLGAWATVDNKPDTILDIGSGTGLIALMLAQRSEAQTIDAIEIEEGAHGQCVDNFESAPWADRLFCYHAGLDEFIDEIEDTYDLIVSNPPFYTEEVSTGNSPRDTARQNRSLPFPELLESASKLLSATGLLSVIIPFKEEIRFIESAEKVNLYPTRITRVKGNLMSPVKRSLLELSFCKKKITETELTIETARHHYTAEYIALTRSFYLKM